MHFILLDWSAAYVGFRVGALVWTGAAGATVDEGLDEDEVQLK